MPPSTGVESVRLPLFLPLLAPLWACLFVSLSLTACLSPTPSLTPCTRQCVSLPHLGLVSQSLSWFLCSSLCISLSLALLSYLSLSDSCSLPFSLALFLWFFVSVPLSANLLKLFPSLLCLFGGVNLIRRSAWHVSEISGPVGRFLPSQSTKSAHNKWVSSH